MFFFSRDQKSFPLEYLSNEEILYININADGNVSYRILTLMGITFLHN